MIRKALTGGSVLALILALSFFVSSGAGTFGSVSVDAPSQIAGVAGVLHEIASIRAWNFRLRSDESLTREHLETVASRLVNLGLEGADSHGQSTSIHEEAPGWWSSGHKPFEHGLMRSWYAQEGWVYDGSGRVTMDGATHLVPRALERQTEAMVSDPAAVVPDELLDLELFNSDVHDRSGEAAIRGEAAEVPGVAMSGVPQADGPDFPAVTASGELVSRPEGLPAPGLSAPAPPKHEEETPADTSSPPAVAPPESLSEESEESPPPQDSTHDTYLNSYIQDIIKTYVGDYPYLLNTDYANYNGVTEDLHFQGALLARAHSSGNRASHCSGITFEVFFKAMQARNLKLGLDADDFNGMTFDELFDFLLIWYVAKGDKSTSNIEVAVETYGIGKRVPGFEAARPGDFVDFDRSNGTGHTVIFQKWVRNQNGNIIGLDYWSTQGSTNGIAFHTEHFDTSGRGNILSNQIYIARVLPVHQYKSFR